MKEHMQSVRGKLGELGAMAAQNEAMERKILKRAEARLSEIEKGMDSARRESLTGGQEAGQRYMDLVEERGTLHQVIAQARAALVD